MFAQYYCRIKIIRATLIHTYLVLDFSIRIFIVKYLTLLDPSIGTVGTL